MGKHPQTRRPRVVVLPGFEPRLAESESDVLPLHYRTVRGDLSAICRESQVASLGFEPRITESKSGVLPLHYEAVGRAAREITPPDPGLAIRICKEIAAGAHEWNGKWAP